MAFTMGKDSVFKIANAAGTTTDISAYVDSVDLPRSVDTAETSTFGSTAKTYIPGLADAKLTLKGKFDGSASAGDSVLAGIYGVSASKAFEFHPQGTTAGTVKYTGSVILTDYSVSSQVGSVVEFTASFQVTGAITRGTN